MKILVKQTAKAGERLGQLEIVNERYDDALYLCAIKLTSNALGFTPPRLPCWPHGTGVCLTSPATLSSTCQWPSRRPCWWPISTTSTRSRCSRNMGRVREEKSILEKQQGDLFLDTNDQDADPSNSQRNNNPIIYYLDLNNGCYSLSF